MMFRSFEEIEKYLLENKVVKRVALCGAHDEPALASVVEAKRNGLVEGTLIGQKTEIIEILNSLGENPDEYEILEETDETEAAKMAVSLVKDGKADIPMKGLLQTASYMRAILDKQTGILPAGKTLSETTVFEYPDQNRFLLITDCGINIEPDLDAKVQIIGNAVELANTLGIENPKVACLSALEKVNPKIRSTVEAETLSKLGWKNCVVEGPFALDNAISPEAAAHKDISGEVAGRADILLVPDLCSGNILHKSVHFFAHNKLAGAVCGTDHPVILTSRTDAANSKYNSILTAILQTIR